MPSEDEPDGDGRAPIGPPTPSTLRRKLALCIGVARFDADTSPPAANDSERPDPLPFAGARVDALSDALARYGYECTTAGTSTQLAARDLGERVIEALITPDQDDVLVVHVLSHGVYGTTGVYALGTDGRHHRDTSVNSWLGEIEDFPGRPRTLFLLDLCHAGDAARQDWQLRRMDGNNRAWVIAASHPGQLAFRGRFTQAVANVLNRLDAGGLAVHEGHRYVPLDWLVEAVRAETSRLATEERGVAQRVTATPIDGAYPELPFLPNPGYRADPVARVRGTADQLAAPFLDEIADLRHFSLHAAGRHPAHGARPPADPKVGLFTGRERQVRLLTAWLNGGDEPGLRVVTGSPGAGKSALIGVLVCAAHPQLRHATVPLWRRLAVAPASNPQLAAVHARGRTLGLVLDSIAAQLRLGRPDPVRPAPELVATVTGLRQPPTIVLDALDEADDPADLTAALLVPLAEAIRPDGRKCCRLLVGTRRGPALSDLLRAARAPGHVIDLDRGSRTELREDLRRYAVDVFQAQPPYDSIGYRPAVAGFADAMADTLTADPDPHENSSSGPFLAAVLYTHHVLRTGSLPRDRMDADRLGTAARRTLPDVLELDLTSRGATRWLRPVLATLAHAAGDGMPVEVIAFASAAFGGAALGGAAPSAAEVQEALLEARSYLRTAPDTDGSALYRLFHQSLADHLRVHPFDGIQPAATPYLAQATSAAALGAVSTYRTSAHRHSHFLAERRRDVLAVDALRHGSRTLAARFADAPAGPARAWRAGWATGTQIGGAAAAMMGAGRPVLTLAAIRWDDEQWRLVGGGPDGDLWIWDPTATEPPLRLSGHAGAVRAVTGCHIAGRPAVLSGGNDGTIRLWDVAGSPSTTTAARLTLHGHSGAVRAIAHVDVAGRPLAVSGGEDGTVRIWDLAEGLADGHELRGHAGAVTAATCLLVDRTAVAVTAGDDGTLRTWDIELGREYGRPLLGHTGPVHALACLDSEQPPPAVVSAGEDGTVRLWDLAAGRQRHQITGHDGPAYAVACSRGPAGPIAITGGGDHAIRVWDLDTARPQDVLLGHSGTVHALACWGGAAHRYIASGGTGDGVRLWDLRPQAGTRSVPAGHGSWVTACACLTADGRVLAVSGGADAAIRVWDVVAGQPIGAPLRGHRGAVYAISCVVVDGRMLAVSGGADATIRVWDIRTGQPAGTPLSGHRGAVYAISCVVVDGRALAVSGGADATIRVWDVLAGRPVGAALVGHQGGINAIACATTTTGPVAVTGADDGAVRLWDLLDRQPASVLRSPGGPWVTAATCVDIRGQAVAVTGTHEGRLETWDLATRTSARLPVPDVTGGINALASGRLDAVPVGIVADDAAVRLWQLDTGEPVDTIGMPGTAAVLDSAGGHLVIGCEWDLVALHLTADGPANPTVVAPGCVKDDPSPGRRRRLPG